MEKHYDAAIVGVWFGANYGSLINGYAIYKALKNMGKSVLMINKPNAAPDDWELLNPHCKRFVDNFYPQNEVSPPLPYDRMHELNNCCDTFLVGSDQIWHYNITKGFNFTMMLNFVDDDKKKISFGTSFGHQRDFTPEDIKPKVKALLQRFNAISMREQSGVDICRDIYGVKATATIEPVFCLTVEQYREMAAHSSINETEPYILSYILDPTPEKIRAIEYYCSVTGMKSINILDGNPFHCKEARKVFNLPNTLEEPGAEDLIKLCLNASFIITDSFHGTCFSIIFNKPFLSIANKKRGTVRFQELTEKFGLSDRLAVDETNISLDKKLLEQTDFTNANRIISEESEAALDWLKNAVETPKLIMPSVILPKNITNTLDTSLCMGCGACVSTCPYDALTLIPDDLGYYRSRVNYDKCIGCGRCVKVCPALSLPDKTNTPNPELFEFVAADKNILLSSSSGGAFPLLAEEAFKKGGCVVGAAWKDDLTVEHIVVEQREELHKLQRSKYLQSYLGNVFRKVKEKLDNHIFVLFTGCPCQVAGLKSYLGKEYDELITVDLLCGNSPSAMFFQKYLQNDFSEKPIKYDFRIKNFGWDPVYIEAKFSDGHAVIRKGVKQDSYQRVYHSHTMCAPHCEKCKYQSVPRFGDLTIGDFWGIGKKDPSIDIKNGVSAVLCNNQKGRRFFDGMPTEQFTVKKQVPLSWLEGNGYAINGSHNYCSPNRNDFYKAIKTMPFAEAINYAVKPNHGIKENPKLFNFSSKSSHFRFNPSVWNENYINGTVVLSTWETRPKVGSYATLPIYAPIKAGKKYVFKTRFKISTDSDVYNFHIKSAGEKIFQVIHTHKIDESNKNTWIEISKEFIADSDIYDEFMIGAAQLSGEERYIAFDYISIDEI